MTITQPIRHHWWRDPNGDIRRGRVSVVAAVALIALFALLFTGLVVPGWFHEVFDSHPTALPVATVQIKGGQVETDKAVGNPHLSNRQLDAFIGRMARHGVRTIGDLEEWRLLEPSQGHFANNPMALRLFKRVAHWNGRHRGHKPMQVSVYLAFAPSWATGDPTNVCAGNMICAPSADHVDAYADAAGHLSDLARSLGVPLRLWVWFQPNVHFWFPSGIGTYAKMFSATSAELAGSGNTVEMPLTPSSTDRLAGNYLPVDFVKAVVGEGLAKSAISGVVLDPTDGISTQQARRISRFLPGVPVSVVYHTHSVKQLAGMVRNWWDNTGHITRGSVGVYFGDHNRPPMHFNAASAENALRGR